MSSRQQMIGYNRNVRIRWLDETLDLFLAGLSPEDLRVALRERLRDELSVGGDAKRGSREKTITLLLRTWVNVPEGAQGLRDDALRFVSGIRREERLPLHWGMTMVAYPFWRTVADLTGRLFRLQGTAIPAQVQRRTKELFGEREVVARSARCVLRSFADWGVIRDASRRGEYAPAAPVRVADSNVAAWLLESAVLGAPDATIDFDALVNGPCLFPFQIARVFPEQLTASGRLDVIRHGLESVLVLVRPLSKPLLVD